MNAAQSVTGAFVRLRHLVGNVSRGRSEPSARLFQGIRLSLTLWFTAGLAVILLVIGVVLYNRESSTLLGPVDSELTSSAQAVQATWRANPEFPCPTGVLGPEQGLLWACYEPGGGLIASDRLVQAVPRFVSPSVVRPAVDSGGSVDVASHTAVGTVRIYAVRVTDPHGTPLGVFEVGAPVGDRITALHTLFTLLVVCSLLGLLAAAVGGFFLATRALRPARLAHVRQRDFIADASHELRTPLTMLRSNVEVVLRGRERLPPEDVALLQDTVAEAGHLTSLANNMLQLARLDDAGIHLETEVVDLGRLAAEVVRWAQALAAEHEVQMGAEADGQVVVVGDKTLLEQAALILIDNAIKYNRPGGRVLARVRVEGDRAVLEVDDTGIGIAPEHLAHLGERFYRVDKARSRESGGAGLGLSLVRSIATRHGGSFDLKSDPEHGTRAILSLPAAISSTHERPEDRG